jgi:twitching motility two-component system response regulator PilG
MMHLPLFVIDEQYRTAPDEPLFVSEFKPDLQRSDTARMWRARDGRMETPQVLLVDDSRVVRKIVEMTLWRERIEVVTATDGLGALASVADAQPDLMLLDILLPHMDGYQVCQVVRHHQDYRDLPVVLLSGKDSVVDRMRGRLAGSTDYISKPFDPAELVWTVKRYLYAPAVWKRAARREQRVRPAPKRWWQR